MFWLSIAHGQELSGYLELRGEASFGVDRQPLRAVQRFRPTLQLPISDDVSLTSTVEAHFSQGRDPQSAFQGTIGDSTLQPLFDLANCQWPEDPGNPVLRIDGVQDWLFVDRLFIDIYQPGIDLRIGRQAMQWGSAQLINPTDPFPEVLFAEPWRPRRGQNAAKATVPLGERHQLQGFVGSDDRFVHLRTAGRLTINVAQADLSAVAAYRGDVETGLVGLDLKGTLGVGYWFEGAWHLAEDPYEELAVGIDYSFPVLDGLIIAGQYYRNGAGSPSAPALTDSPLAAGLHPPDCETFDLDGLLPGTPQPFAPFTAGRDYALLSALFIGSPEWKASLGVLQNLGDGTGVAVPTLTLSPTGWLEVSASAQLTYRAWGDGGEFRRPDRTIELDLDGASTPLDLDGFAPEANAFLWTRARL